MGPWAVGVALVIGTPIAASALDVDVGRSFSYANYTKLCVHHRPPGERRSWQKLSIEYSAPMVASSARGQGREEVGVRGAGWGGGRELREAMMTVGGRDHDEDDSGGEGFSGIGQV